jgi:sulfur dioxygenase
MSIIPFLSTQGVISYLVTNTNNEAIIIDPSFEMAQKIVLYIKQNNLQPKYILDTHTHADFFSSRQLFKTLYPEAKVGLSQYSPTADNELKLTDGQKLDFEEVDFQVWQAHGHTNESLVFVASSNGQTNLFSGDTLFIGGTGRTDFQLGESQALYEALARILTLPETTIVYPGHNYQGQTKTTLAVEKLTNPRLKLVLDNKNQDFIDLMQSHQPPAPDLFEESLKWNSK